MICPNCSVLNEDGYVFCVNCGAHFTNNSGEQAGSSSSVQIPPTVISPQNINTSNSVETSVVPRYQNSIPNFQQTQFTPGSNYVQPRRKSNALLIGGGLFVLLLLLVGGGAAVYFVNQNSGTAESLPAHFGLFFQNQEKNAVSEIKKQDFTSVTAAKDEIMKNESLPSLPAKPNFVLYAENKDIPHDELKLIQFDSIKEDGSLKQLDIQVAPVEGKPEMKRIRTPENIANGKYAFALFNGFFDEGKHKFWAFSVKNSEKSDNGELAKNITLNLKPKDEKQQSPPAQTDNQKKELSEAPPPQTASVPPPAGARIGFLTQGNVVMRAAPTQYSAKIGGFKSGQKVYIINYSGNYESFKHLYSNYAYVQTESGKRGWVYAAFLR